LSNSSRHLTIPLFVDWLPTGQWSAVSPAVLKRGSAHKCTADKEVPQMAWTLKFQKTPSRYLQFFFVFSWCWLCSYACLISLIASHQDDSRLARAAQQFIYPWRTDGSL